MARKIRRLRPPHLYESTFRTVDRQFLFKPNHHPKNPLLEQACPIEALDPNNDIISKLSVINVIGASIGRALRANPIQIHWYESNIEEPGRGHLVCRDPDIASCVLHRYNRP